MGTEEDFNQFWDAFPRKVGKRSAHKKWVQLKPDLSRCIETLAWQKESNQWKKNGGKFVPHPTTWLNQGRWDDEKPDAHFENGPGSEEWNVWLKSRGSGPGSFVRDVMIGGDRIRIETDPCGREICRWSRGFWHNRDYRFAQVPDDILDRLK